MDRFYECENMLVIRPVDAIKPDSEPGLDIWLDLNRNYSELWPNIKKKKPGPGCGRLRERAGQIRQIL